MFNTLHVACNLCLQNEKSDWLVLLPFWVDEVESLMKTLESRKI